MLCNSPTVFPAAGDDAFCILLIILPFEAGASSMSLLSLRNTTLTGLDADSFFSLSKKKFHLVFDSRLRKLVGVLCE